MEVQRKETRIKNLEQKEGKQLYGILNETKKVQILLKR